MTEVECLVLIKKDGQLLVDQTRIDLLFQIQQTGSLQAASKKLGISYQHAWNMIAAMNKLADAPFVIKQRGGVSGGGATLTPSALRVMDEFAQIKVQIGRFITKINTDINM